MVLWCRLSTQDLTWSYLANPKSCLVSQAHGVPWADEETTESLKMSSLNEQKCHIRWKRQPACPSLTAPSTAVVVEWWRTTCCLPRWTNHECPQASPQRWIRMRTFLGQNSENSVNICNACSWKRCAWGSWAPPTVHTLTSTALCWIKHIVIQPLHHSVSYIFFIAVRIKLQIQISLQQGGA